MGPWRMGPSLHKHGLRGGGSEIFEECGATRLELNPGPFLCARVCRGSFLVVLPRLFFYPFAAPSLFPNWGINLIIIK